MKPEDWPRLSEVLDFPEPGRCNGCGCNRPHLTLWQESDHNDKPELRYVWLCQVCTEQLVERHARLYHRLNRYAPAPGAMDICRDCQHRRRTFCPVAKGNGGPGVIIQAPKPAMAFVDGTRNGRRTGWREVFYSSPPTACSGKICLPTP